MQTLKTIIPLASLICLPASAVELGPFEVKSYLNQPFSAVLTLNDVSANELADIRFRLADRELYRRFKLPPPSNLKSVRFKIVAAENGSYELHISSRQRVVEPILNLLIQVNEKQGHFFRQYTLLIDPPQAAADLPPAQPAGIIPDIDKRPELLVADSIDSAPEPQHRESGTLLVRNYKGKTVVYPA